MSFRLLRQARQLVRSQGQNPEHQVGHDLGGAAHPQRAAAELILQPGVAALGIRPLVVTRVFRQGVTQVRQTGPMIAGLT